MVKKKPIMFTACKMLLSNAYVISKCNKMHLIVISFPRKNGKHKWNANEAQTTNAKTALMSFRWIIHANAIVFFENNVQCDEIMLHSTCPF